MRFEAVGDGAVTVWLERRRSAAGPGPAALVDAMRAAAPAGIVGVVPAFDTITVVYDAARLNASPQSHYDSVCRWIARVVAERPRTRLARNAGVIDVPVEYGGVAGPDLAELAQTLGLTEDRIIALHSSATYTVAAIGFLPGFAYLEGLPKSLHVPRRQTPRTRVPAGSVAIGGPYTGVYPVVSPGGWHLIGRTTAVLFNPAKPQAVPWRVGDRVRFKVLPV
jgi:inhibitor of KinA